MPEIFQGGSSRAARDMAVPGVGLVLHQRQHAGGASRSRSTTSEPRPRRRRPWRQDRRQRLRHARDTEAEAQAVLGEIIAKANPEAVQRLRREVKNAGKASPEGEGNWAKSSFEDLVQYNDGFRTNLIGTPEQIAERIIGAQGGGRRSDPARLPAFPGGGRVFRQACACRWCASSRRRSAESRRGGIASPARRAGRRAEIAGDDMRWRIFCARRSLCTTVLARCRRRSLRRSPVTQPAGRDARAGRHRPLLRRRQGAHRRRASTCGAARSAR